MQIYQQPAISEPTHPVTSNNARQELHFMTTAPDSSLLWDGTMDGDVQILSNAFYACSENGFVISRKPKDNANNEETWRSSVLGGRIKLSWGA